MKHDIWRINKWYRDEEKKKKPSDDIGTLIIAEKETRSTFLSHFHFIVIINLKTLQQIKADQIRNGFMCFGYAIVCIFIAKCWIYKM